MWWENCLRAADLASKCSVIMIAPLLATHAHTGGDAMDNRRGSKANEGMKIQLASDEFELTLNKTDLRPEQWAKICLLFNSLDEVMRDRNDGESFEWRKCG